jgi:hypothetical protein
VPLRTEMRDARAQERAQQQAQRCKKNTLGHALS